MSGEVTLLVWDELCVAMWGTGIMRYGLAAARAACGLPDPPYEPNATGYHALPYEGEWQRVSIHFTAPESQSADLVRAIRDTRPDPASRRR